MEHVSEGKVARKQYASNARRSGPADRSAPLTACATSPFRSFLAQRRFKWNEMANCGDAYVFFDPLDSSESMLASDNQTLALHNGCQEVVSKGGLDKFVRPTRSSITLTFNTLEANNKNHHLSRGSKYGHIRMFKNEGPLKPIPTLDKLPNSCAIVKAPMERARYSTHGQRH